MRGRDDKEIANRIAWRAKSQEINPSLMIIDETQINRVVFCPMTELSIGTDKIIQNEIAFAIDDILSLIPKGQQTTTSVKFTRTTIDIMLKSGEPTSIESPPGECRFAIKSIILMLIEMQK